ncbi:unnamed protein product [Caenorhabditis brenneri]
MAKRSRTNPSSSLLKLKRIEDMDEFKTTSESSTSGRHRGRSRHWLAAQQHTDHRVTKGYNLYSLKTRRLANWYQKQRDPCQPEEADRQPESGSKDS